MRRPAAFCTALAASGLMSITLAAHPTPFSNIAIDVAADRAQVSVIAYAYDFAQQLARVESQTIEPSFAGAGNERIAALVKDRVRIELDGRIVESASVGVAVASDRSTATVTLHYAAGATERVRVTATLFPYDPIHESFVTVRSGGRLSGEAILTAGRPTAQVTLGAGLSKLDVLRRFIRSGIEHIAIGPDHVLFLVGLLLLGGSVWQLVKIVTAFTLAHSVTLSLAVLNIVAPPAWLVEPAIAITICIVGISNLIQASRDPRIALAFFFGLIHGFGFAAVLKTMDLPRAALGWSLFAFNVGVEIGQLVIVVVVAGLLAWAGRNRPVLRRRIAMGGSLAVLWAGFYWLVQRVFFG